MGDVYVPNNASQKKRLRQSETRRLRNRKVRSGIRTQTKKLLALDSADGAEAALSELYTALDRAARKNLMPPKTAARKKALAARHVNGLINA